MKRNTTTTHELVSHRLYSQLRQLAINLSVGLLTVGITSAWADLNLPVTGGTISSGVGLRLDPFGTGKLIFHRGIDIAVPVGTPVHATRVGRVIFTGVHGGFGITVIIEHQNGDRTVYGHNSKIIARKGERVNEGAIVALSGNSGRSTGPHVHYETQAADGSIVVAGHLPQGGTVTRVEEGVGTARQGRPEETAGSTCAVTAIDAEFRAQQERKIEETVGSLLQKIHSSSVVSGHVKQGS